MARTLQKLSDVAIKAEKRAGRHSDGGGLYLNVTASGTKSWLFMWVPSGGNRKEMGLGAYPAVSLSKARSKAAECREMVADGLDPIAERDKGPEPTFKECASAYIKAVQSEWSNDKHKSQWEQTLGTPCARILDKRVSQITIEDVLLVLRPIWAEKAETASRLRGRIERVLNFAKTEGWRTGENPATWRGNLQNALPKRKKLQRGHHTALPYAEVPAFMVELRHRPAMAARALEFTILTAARTGEAVGAKWSEIDLAKKLWTVPAERMKAKTEHLVPLSVRCIEIITALEETAVGEYVFPSPLKPLSGMAMLMLLRRMNRGDLTVHGFRSSFRDWCGDETSFPREIAEAALAHKIGNEVEQAYRRSSALEKRRKLMEAWANYLDPGARGTVLTLRGYTPR